MNARTCCARVVCGVVVALSFFSAPGCSRTIQFDNTDFVEFVPATLDTPSDLVEHPELMRDASFRVGLAVVLTKYGHIFLVTPDTVLYLKPSAAHPQAEENLLLHEDEQYRMNLTHKAIGAAEGYKESIKY